METNPNVTPWKEKAQYIVAGLVITYAFLWLFMLLFKLIPPENKEVVNILSAQVVVAGTLTILNWMFGSSKSSGEKDGTIAMALAAKTPNGNGVGTVSEITPEMKQKLILLSYTVEEIAAMKYDEATKIILSQKKV